MQTRDYLTNRLAGNQSMLGMDKMLVECAKSEDPVIREMVPSCARFWYGTDEENERLEQMLVQLTKDDGKGENRREEFNGDVPSDTTEVLGRPGFIVQVNATQALVRRGSSETPIELLKELLDEDHLKEMVQVKQADNTQVANTGKAQMILFATLQAIEHRHNKDSLDLAGIRPMVAELTQHPNTTIQGQAKKTLETLSN